MPFKVTITNDTWNELREPLSGLLREVVDGWRTKMAEENEGSRADE